jgi:hypothetical protein
MNHVMDDIFVEKIHGSGHYVLSAIVNDGANSFRHSMQFYFYDWDEIDEMKLAYLGYLESNNLVIDED